jgi:hypothetical protein
VVEALNELAQAVLVVLAGVEQAVLLLDLPILVEAVVEEITVAEAVLSFFATPAPFNISRVAQ